jgi:hypothetical protein
VVLSESNGLGRIKPDTERAKIDASMPTWNIILQDDAGATPLHLAATDGHVDITTLLISAMMKCPPRRLLLPLCPREAVPTWSNSAAVTNELAVKKYVKRHISRI